MFLPATVDIAEWKEDIAPQMMQPGELVHHIIALSRLLSVIKDLKCLTRTFSDAQAFLKSEPLAS
jgi:hypothetical protein